MFALYVLDSDRNPVLMCDDATSHDAVMKWVRWSAELDTDLRRRVDLTHLPDGRKVSTVFVGVGHVLFETAVFSGDGSVEIVGRNSTWQEAAEAHVKVVSLFLEASHGNRD
jgi:hypothetical protein